MSISDGLCGVYAVALPGTMAVKIGWSTNIAKRLHGLSTSMPFRPILVGYLETDNGKDEKKIHSMLAEYRIRGEWFLWCDDVRDCIEEIFTRVSDASDAIQAPLPIRDSGDEPSEATDLLDSIHTALASTPPSCRDIIFRQCGVENVEALTIEGFARALKGEMTVDKYAWKDAMYELSCRLRECGANPLADAMQSDPQVCGVNNIYRWKSIRWREMWADHRASLQVVP